MKRPLLFAILILLSLACKENSIEKLNKINEEINENLSNQVFLSLFPGMSFDTEKHLINREIKNNNLKVESFDWGNVEYYIFPIDGEDLKFSVYCNSYSIKLIHHYQSWQSSPTKNSVSVGRDNYDRLIRRIKKIFKTKYGEPKELINILPVNKTDDYQYANNDVMYQKFTGDSKDIIINYDFDVDYRHPTGIFNDFDYITNKEGQTLIYSYEIEISYFTKDSFKEMRTSKIKDSLQLIENKRLKMEKQLDEDNEKKNKLLNDI
jgi:hypothetical protein